MKKVFFLVLVLSTTICVSAKKRNEAPETVQKVKTTDHYIGLQANFLVREFFNLGGSNAAVLNPYGFVYHLNNRRSGWGFRIGLGPSIYNTINQDGQAEIRSKGYDLNGRIGLDKRFVLDRRWEAGAGIDGVFYSAKDETVNDQITFQGFITETRNTTTSYGGGAMGYLRYRLRPNILLGTEASFYYLSGKRSNRAKISDQTGQVFQEDDDNDEFGQGTLSLPISLYLLIKF